MQCYLTLLANVPDTLIARKRGLETATEVSRWAAETLALGGALTPQGQDAVADLDRRLRDERHTLNPGTTADLTTAALFLLLLREPALWYICPQSRSVSVLACAAPDVP